jgi:hypothetical protein
VFLGITKQLNRPRCVSITLNESTLNTSSFSPIRVTPTASISRTFDENTIEMKIFYTSLLLTMVLSNFAYGQNLCFDEAADVNYATGNGPQSIASGDFNEDGDMDAVVVNYLQGNLSVYFGNGDGTFENQVSIEGGSVPTEVEVADIDNDNNLDVIWCQNSSAVLMVAKGNGNGTFQSVVASVVDNWLDSYRQQFVLVDLSEDGDLDVVVNDHDGDRIVVMIGDGNGSFSASQTLTTGNQPLDVTIGDFNNDGNADIACGYAYTENFITVFMNNGSGTLNNGTNVTVGNPFYFYLEVGKFDNDNFNDILVAGLTEVHFLSGNNNGTFDPSVTYGMGGYASEIIAKDFDENGELDIFISNESGGSVSFRSGNGNGTFGTLTPSSAKGEPIDAAADDFDNDGILDVVTANYGNDNISFLKGIGNGKFGPNMLNTFGTPYALASGDVNNDGNADIATAESFPGGLSFMMGTGDGTFEESVSLISNLTFQDVAIMDVNNDNFDDIIGMYASTQLGVLISNGNGTFDPEVIYTAGSGAGGDREIHVTDIDGDGDNDILGLYMQDDAFSVLKNNGNGTFASEVSYSTGDLPMDITAGDYDGDGDEDVFIAVYNTNSISYFANNGNGTFASPIDVGAGLSPRSVVTGDWNNDGDLDVACVNNNSVDISIFVQPDGGGLPSPTSISTGVNSSPMEIIQGDVNGDGDTDLIVALPGYNSIGVLFGNGDGTFQSAIQFPVEQSPYDVVVADFNNDGALDLGASNYESYTVSVILNNSSFINANGPTTFCEGENVVLTASAGAFYLWSNGATTQSITVTESGEYYCAITNQSGDCTLITATITVTVNDSNISVTIFDEVWENACEGATPFPLDGGSPQGGTYTGEGVTNGLFDPSIGAGTYEITYTYQEQGGCASGSDVALLTVYALPTITFTAEFPSVICIEGGIQALDGASPEGGTYSGLGITNNNIDPSVTGEGTFGITYTYTDDNGCTASEVENVLVDLCDFIGETNNVLFKAYPSLFQHTLNIELQKSERIYITDVTGKIVFESLLPAGLSTLQTEKWESGLYILRIHNQNYRLQKIH